LKQWVSSSVEQNEGGQEEVLTYIYVLVDAIRIRCLILVGVVLRVDLRHVALECVRVL